MNRLKTLSLIMCLAWNTSTYAENEETFTNPFSKLPPIPKATPSGYDFPPLPPQKKHKQSKPKKVVTEYYSKIRPGDKLPTNVYECALKNLRGIGSDVAAKIVWQACLRLHLK